MPLRFHIHRMQSEQAARREAARKYDGPSLLEPYDNQLVFHWAALQRSCPFCNAEPHEPCRPSGMAKPHRVRVEAARA